MLHPLLLCLCATISMWAEASVPADPPPSKRVEIDKTTQMLRAYEGDRLVLESRVSTGRRGKSTPSGQFAVRAKFRMHYSSRYQNAPMPYSVQVVGHYFIHGYKVVPEKPASHGCIRLPLVDGNPARQFFEWVEIGTPVVITGKWEGPAKGRAVAGQSPRQPVIHPPASP
jgi:lipoprotein-anchoring transpeptidase ErfK/SrfK